MVNDVRISKYRDRQELESFYFMEIDLVACSKVSELMAALDLSYNHLNGGYSLIHLRRVLRPFCV